MTNTKSINTKIFHGALWTLLMRFFFRTISLVSLLLLARIFSPEEFGLIAKAVILKEVLEAFTQLGLEAALIRNPHARKSDYNTAWTMSIIRGLLICFVLILISSQVTVFFNDPRLEMLIYCYAISVAIRGFANLYIVDFRKKMLFNLDFKYSLCCKLSEFTPTILIALYFKTYWALPLGTLCGSIALVAISFVMANGSPQFGLTKWRSMLHFAKWIFTHEISVALSYRLDTILLGRLSSNQSLGSYTMASEVAYTPTKELAMPVGRAALPGLASESGNRSKFNAINTNILANVIYIALPMSLGLFAVSELAANVLLGDKWLNTHNLIRLLVLAGLLRTFSAMSAATLIAFGKVHILGKTSALLLPIRAVLIFLGFYQGGLIGLCYGVIFTNGAAAAIHVFIQHKLNILDIKSLISNVWPSLLAASTMLASMQFSKPFIALITGESGLYPLTCNVLLGCFIYSLCVYLLWMICGKPNGIESRAIEYISARIKRTS